MRECHVVHIGRDSRLKPALIDLVRQSQERLALSFSRHGQRINDVTEVYLDDRQIAALVEGLIGYLSQDKAKTVFARLYEHLCPSIAPAPAPAPEALDGEGVGP